MTGAGGAGMSRILIVAAILCGSGFVTEADAQIWIDPNPTAIFSGDPCARFTEDVEYRNYRIHMHLRNSIISLRIPKYYVTDPLFDYKAEDRPALLLSISLDTFDPVTVLDTERRTIEGKKNYFTILLSDTISLSDNVMGRLRRTVNGSIVRFPLESIAQRAHEYDLKHLDFVAQGKEIYLSGSIEGGEEPEAIFYCSRPNANGLGSPMCEHRFKFQGLTVKMAYRRVELPEWNEIQSQVTKFLTCAYVSEEHVDSTDGVSDGE